MSEKSTKAQRLAGRMFKTMKDFENYDESKEVYPTRVEEVYPKRVGVLAPGWLFSIVEGTDAAQRYTIKMMVEEHLKKFRTEGINPKATDAEIDKKAYEFAEGVVLIEVTDYTREELIQMQHEIYPRRVVSLSNGFVIWTPEGTDAEQREFLKQSLFVHIKSLKEDSYRPEVTDTDIDMIAYDLSRVATLNFAKSRGFDDDFKQLSAKVGL